MKRKHPSRGFISIPEINKSQKEILEILEELLLISEELAMSKTLSTFSGEIETVSPEEFEVLEYFLIHVSVP